MKYFLLRLIPPRSTFAQDMNSSEAEVMQRHFAYWADLAKKGRSLLYGPVADPSGMWGVAIIGVEDEGQAQGITAADPAMKSQLGFRYDMFEMPQILTVPK
jgi:uncharacterized protein YciI